MASEAPQTGPLTTEVAALLKPVPKCATTARSAKRWNRALLNVNEALYSTYANRVHKGVVTAPQMVALLDELAAALYELRENVKPTPLQDDKLGDISDAIKEAQRLLSKRPPPVVRVSVRV